MVICTHVNDQHVGEYDHEDGDQHVAYIFSMYHCCCLACSVVTQESGDLPLVGVEGDVVHCHHRVHALEHFSQTFYLGKMFSWKEIEIKTLLPQHPSPLKALLQTSAYPAS